MDGHNSSRPTSAVTSPGLRSRAHSISSDRPSTANIHSLSTPPISTSPEPAFIAGSAAAQIVTNDHDSHADAWYDQNGIEPSDEPAYVSDGALELVNSFLDQLLFNFLHVSRSTKLSNLRPAVTEILKPKLARDTIANADEELGEYLGGADEDDYVQPQGSSTRGWDLELVWKRTRLRCMVYSSLGDMEEEDEDMYMEQEDLEVGVDEQISDVISPAVAIFLTSIVEYMGELTLTVAGQAAYHRVRTDIEKGLRDGTRQAGDMADQIVVGEADMERVALDRTLGRLWRGWKKRLRSPITDAMPRPFSSAGHSRHGSLNRDLVSPKSPVADADVEGAKVEETIVEDVQPADIPLPIGARDVDEIEVPGLVSYSDEESEAEDEDFIPARPKSFHGKFHGELDFTTMQDNSNPDLPAVKPRQRSNSLPAPPTTTSVFNQVEIQVEEQSPDVVEEAKSGDAEPDEDFVSDLSDDDELKVNRSRGPVPTGLGLTTPRSRITKKASSASVADDSAWDSEGPDEVATYEKAEVVTSSRVSVDSSPSSSDDSSKRGHKRSTSSMHSARIVDVQAPRSSGSSPRPGSIDIARRRSVSLSSAAALVSTAAAAGAVGVGAVMVSKMGRDASPIDKTSQGLPTPTVRAPVERAKQTARSAATISESEEESDYHSARGKESMDTAAPAVARSNEDTQPNLSPKSGMRLDVEKATRSALIDREPLSPRLVNTSYDGRPSPNPAIKTPTSPGPRHLHGFRENKPPPTLERLRTQEEEEEFATPLHSIAPPRAIHTSGSSGSSVTGKAKVIRSSEENSSTSRSESVARNFEDLIQSNQTITYTLTPESMRHVDSSKRSLDSPVVTKFSRRQSEDARSPSSASQPPATLSGSPTVIRDPGFENSVSPEIKPSGPIPRAPTGIAVTTGRMHGPQARDARVSADTTSDFAQFIKSTGPVPESRQPPGSRRSNDTANISGPVPRAPESARRASTISNKSRFQPREAAVTSKSDTRELIDFIRQGPPIAASNHRIPRHVAPFRTTMDSDQLAGAPGGKAVDASIPEVRYDVRYSHASTNVTDNSMQSSMNSNSALLKARTGNSKIASMFGEEDMPMPQRKTHRVRDPYALDFSDEEDDEEEDDMPVAPRGPAKREESLAEFLRNYDPPGEPASAPPQLPKKKASAPSLMGRFTRSNTNKDTASIASTEARSLSSRAGGSTRGYVPIQVSMPPGYDKYGPIEPQSSTARARIPSMPGSSGRVPMKKFEPREPSTYRSETSDLADFLRSSGPPGGITAPAVQPIREESGSSLSKMFGRRKKTFM